MFCKYRNIFGKVGKGAHRHRLLNIAIVDVVATILMAFLLWKFALPSYHFLAILSCLFLLGILAHRLFCVRTTVDKFLFK